jgi:transcriptional regulator with XRE-family HTH domain
VRRLICKNELTPSPIISDTYVFVSVRLGAFRKRFRTAQAHYDRPLRVTARCRKLEAATTISQPLLRAERVARTRNGTGKIATTGQRPRTQQVFADRIGVSQNYLSAMEHGKVRIGVETVSKISEQHGKSLEESITGRGRTRNESASVERHLAAK